MEQIVRRLEIIRNLLLLGEEDEVSNQLIKLQYADEGDVHAIVREVRSGDLDAALILIDRYLSRVRSVTTFQNPRIKTLKVELASLQRELQTLTNEKAEAERLVHEFLIHHIAELGARLEEYHRLRTETLRRRARVSLNENETTEYREAKREEAEFRQNAEAVRKEPSRELSNDERQSLKRMFREASKLCHPDMVAEADRVQAHEVFMHLEDAYRNNDLETVSSILESLQGGRLFVERAAELDQAAALEREIDGLRQRCRQLSKDLELIRGSETWRMLASIDDWDFYFKDRKRKLDEDINRMRAELNV